MTFNLRFDNPADGARAWLFRKDLVIAVIRRRRPALLGTQEGLARQLSDLRDALPEYRVLAFPRTVDDTAQCPTLFYRYGDLEAQGGGEFWLSRTPSVPLSSDWNSAFPRMISYGTFRHGNSGKTFLAAVTHLDHASPEARFEQAAIVSRWVRGRKEPVLVMGDFNDSPGSAVHRLLAGAETGLRDTWQVLEKEEGPRAFTHHDFEGIPRKTRMDWILAGPDFDVVDGRILRDHEGSRFPSDHFPYEAGLAFRERRSVQDVP
jgi:endonuclease/exonuclease/phosphatase family metal-dependent hydrolase